MILVSSSVYADPLVPKPEGEPHLSVNFDFVQGLIIVKASINGRLGDYILDTGSPELIMNQHIDQSDFTLWMVGHEQDGQFISVDNFQFGHQTENEFNAWATDLSFLEKMLQRPIDGIIGTKMFSTNKLFLDYEKNSIRFIDGGDEDLDISTNSYHISTISFTNTRCALPIVDVEVGEESLKMLFDTGAAISVLHSDNENSDRATDQFEETVKLNQVKVDKMLFVQEELDELKGPSDEPIDGVLSVSSLNSSKIVIDYTSSRIHILWSK